jgi:predicted nucleic acid-binding protein
MARYVIDAPTLLHLVTSGVDVDRSHQLVSTSSVRSDMLALLFDAVRRGEVDAVEARRLHVAATELKLRLLGDRVSRWTAWQIATEQGWSEISGAEYLALVRLQADALVTVDRELAARASGVVPVKAIEVLAAS